MFQYIYGGGPPLKVDKNELEEYKCNSDYSSSSGNPMTSDMEPYPDLDKSIPEFSNKLNQETQSFYCTTNY